MAMNPRLLVPRASFDPGSLPGLELWLDATQASSITLNTGNSPATVSEWRDRRSTSSARLGRNASGQQPEYVAVSLNGLPGIKLAAGKTLGSESYSNNFAQPTSYFVVFRTPADNATWSLFDGVTTRQHIFGNTNTQLVMFAGSSATAITVAADTVYAAVFVYDGASSTARLNTKTALTRNPGANNISGLFVGTSQGLRNDINEFGLLSRAVTDSEANRLMDYLSKKWGVTLT
jgi:hypothetical protein